MSGRNGSSAQTEVPGLLTNVGVELSGPDFDSTPRGTHARLILGIDGMVSSRSEHEIESTLNRLSGVVAMASFPTRSLTLEFDRRACALPEIVLRLDNLGYRLRQGKPLHEETLPDDHPRARPRPIRRNAAIRFFRTLIQNPSLLTALLAALLLIGATATRMLHGPPALRYLLVGLSFVLAGWETAIDTAKILLQLRFDIDVLMFAAAFGAAALGNFEEGAFLLVLFAFGGAGEELALDRARLAIEALAKLAPDTATIRGEDGQDRLVRVEALQLGNRVVVRPFDRFPADGTVESGTSAVDQSPITGESVPVEKPPGAAVFAGSINGEGLLVVSVAKLASESTLAKIVKMVNEAQATKSPTQLFTDKVEKIYVPLVLLGTASLIVLPPLLGFHSRHDPLHARRGWFYQAMSFLTAASPCALAIGTPAAVLSGIARAAKLGVLVKGGVHLENLGKLRVVAFDKTGTLTRGKPVVTDIIPLGDATPDQVLAYAAAVEKSSSHPLAAAILAEAQTRSLKISEAVDAQQVPALGVTATVDGRQVGAGRVELFGTGNEHAVSALALKANELAAQGKSIVAVGVGGTAVGVIALADRPRDNAAETLRRLKRIGIERTIMLTGDRAAVAANVAAEIGIDEFHGDLLPKDKLDRVTALQNKYGPLAMIGDGVNDAPALATASVGIAMGGAGTDVAIETADVALMGDDLAKLPVAISLSRFSRHIVKQNLCIALGVIGVLAPLAALGFTYLGVAVLFHEGSTVIVVLNSLRLLAYKPKV